MFWGLVFESLPGAPISIAIHLDGLVLLLPMPNHQSELLLKWAPPGGTQIQVPRTLYTCTTTKTTKRTFCACAARHILEIRLRTQLEFRRFLESNSAGPPGAAASPELRTQSRRASLARLFRLRGMKRPPQAQALKSPDGLCRLSVVISNS